MCRALAYLGQPLALTDLLHRPRNGLVAQSYDPKQLHMLNLAGLGLVAWTNAADTPLTYRSTTVPVYDKNLASLAEHVQTDCCLAHIRGIAYRPDASFWPHNLHPFQHPGTRLALAHNGDLAGFERMKPALAARLSPERVLAIRGTTDSEWIYATLLHCLGGRAITVAALGDALRQTVAVLREARAETGIDTSSSMNLFFTDGQVLGVARFTFDFGRYALEPSKVHEANTRYLSLWYGVGERFAPDARGRWALAPAEGRPQALLCASEPLSADPAGWVEVAEYTALLAERGPDGLRLQTLDLEDDHVAA